MIHIHRLDFNQMLALGAAGCARPQDRFRMRAGSVTVAIDGGERDMSPTVDRNSKFLLFLPTAANRGSSALC